jgi:hypothetical protein
VRLERVLEKVTVLTAEELRWLRAIAMLELAGRAAAQPPLERLAREGPTGRLRQDAKAALTRLAMR